MSSTRIFRTTTPLHGWLWGLLAFCLLVLFRDGIWHSAVPAFRDSFHFYYPQAVWLDQCAARGEYFPLWNPNEGLGVSVVGQPSSGIYYPLRILWFLPGLNTAQRLTVSVIVHLLIAAIGMRYAASKLRLSNYARWLAMFSFCLSCPIIFQHINLIYLHSAAWLGFALGGIVVLVRSQATDSASATSEQRVTHNTSVPQSSKRASTLCWSTWYCSAQMRSCFVFAAAVGMMLLAGDLHTSVNAFIIACLVGSAQILGIAYRSARIRTNRILPAIAKAASALFFWLVAAAGIVGAVGFLQMVPAWRWAQHSDRLPTGKAIRVTELPTIDLLLELRANRDVMRDAALREPSHNTYDFSLSPWHVATCFFPTLGGHYLPANSRLFAAIPAEGRMWIPSLYFGIVPALLVLLSLRHCSQRVCRYLLGLAVFSLLASLGNYSLVWLARQMLIFGGSRELTEAWPADSFTSVYWLLTKCLPAYEAFRYPAKWTVWFVLACSLLAGYELDHLHDLKTRLVNRATTWIAGLSGLGLLATVVGGYLAIGSNEEISRWLASAAPDVWLGPPRVTPIVTSLLAAFSLPLVVLTLLWFVSRRSSARGFMPTVVLVATAFEMSWCASHWIQYGPIVAGERWASQPAQAPIEFSQSAWVDTSEADLVRDVLLKEPAGFTQAHLDYQRQFLLGKTALLRGTRNLAATQSLEPGEVRALRSMLMAEDDFSLDQPVLDACLRELGVNQRLVRTRWVDQSSAFQWVAMAGASTLCELRTNDVSAETNASPLSWAWASSSQLDIYLPEACMGNLLVRQFNDGGWTAQSEAGDELPISPEVMLVEISVTRPHSTIRLSRKWLW